MSALLKNIQQAPSKKAVLLPLDKVPDGHLYLEKAYQTILRPIYGNQEKFLQKIHNEEDRFCEILQENSLSTGLLVCKKRLTQEYSEFQAHNSFEIKSLFLTEPEINSGRGLGSLLLYQAARHAIDRNADSICVTVNSQKPESLIFFIKNDFSIVNYTNVRYSQEYLLCHKSPKNLSIKLEPKIKIKMQDKEHINKVLNFIHFSEKLKTELRKGYTSSQRRESVAEHSWRVSLCVMLLGDSLDKKIIMERALKMAITHDIVEAICGDTPCSDYLHNQTLTRKVKDRELEAILEIQKQLPSKLGSEIYELWMEFEKGDSYEAKFVRAIDKIEAQLQFNETSISNWSTFDRSYSQSGINEFCAFDSSIEELRQFIQNESLIKITGATAK